MTTESLPEKIKQKARQLGFTLAGITSPGQTESFSRYKRWIEAGKHAGMDYLARTDAMVKREDTSRVMPEAKSVIVLGLPYHAQKAEKPVSEKTQVGQVAAYAWGKDYHDVIPALLTELVETIRQNSTEPISCKIYTDTGPILERELAVKAGLGWIGRNSCLINPNHGSYFLLSEIFINLDLTGSIETISDHCGTCHRCIDACPTQCIGPDRVIDAVQCISYQTIENKNGMDERVGSKAGTWIFGCDICQQVCPWNIRFSDLTPNPALQDHPPLKKVDLLKELDISPQEFNAKFKRSPVKRAKRRGYLRNILNVLGNYGTANTLASIEPCLRHDEELVRQSAELAMAKIKKRMDET